MTRLSGILLACALAAPASAAELSLDLGRFASGLAEDVGRAEGSVLRLGIAGSRKPSETVQFAVETRYGTADGLDGGHLGAGWAGVSVRYLRILPASTRAVPFAGLGFDVGSDLRRGESLDVSSPSVSGHLVAGLRMPLSDNLGATMSIVAGLDGAAVPWMSVCLGTTWSLDL